MTAQELGLDGDTFAHRFAVKMAAIKAASEERVSLSLAERLAFLERCSPGTIATTIGALSFVERQRLLFAWSFWARPKQLAPAGAWDLWLNLGGRGVGKTRTGAEWTWNRIRRGQAVETALVGPTFGEIRRIMVGGFERRADGMNGSGLLDVVPSWVTVELKEQKGEIRFPQFGARAYFVSAEKPEFLGYNPGTIWCDEPIAWPQPEKLLEHLFFANRKRGGVRPQMCMTTTPRPVQWLRELILDEGTATVHSTSFENRANLATGWIERMTRTMAGTRQGQQELEAELLGDNPDALFAATVIDLHRVTAAPPLQRIAVAIDPAVSMHRKSDATGIVAVGRAGRSDDGELYVLGDKTAKYSWDGWAEAAFDLAELVGASVFVVERNRSGDAAAANLRTAAAKRGYTAQPRRDKGVDLVGQGRRIEIVEVLALGDKAQRAGPLSTAYSKGRVHHVGHMPALEAEMVEWDPRSGISPNGLDALTHGATELLDLDKPAKVDPRDAFKGFAEANALLDRARINAGGEVIGSGLGGGSLGSFIGDLSRGRWGRTI